MNLKTNKGISDEQWELQQKVEEIINTTIRPILHQHNGEIKIQHLDKETLLLEFQGACKTCPSAQITVENVVKTALKGVVNTVRIVNNTDEELLNLAKSILNRPK